MTVLAVMIGLWLPGAFRAQADTIVLMADPWCPYNCEPGSDREGFMVDLTRLVLEEAGHSLIYKTVNWSRAIVGARQGLWTGIIGAAPSEAPDFVYPAEPLGQSRSVFVVRAEDPWNYREPSSLDGRVVGTVRDYDYGDLAPEILTHGTVVEMTGLKAVEDNFRKLLSGRLDVVVADHAVARSVAQALQADDRVRHEIPPTSPVPLFVAFSPAFQDAPLYARVLEEGVARLRSDGRLDAVLARYGVADWKAIARVPDRVEERSRGAGAAVVEEDDSVGMENLARD